MESPECLKNLGRPVVVATHPRSGTHLTIDLLRKQFDECKGWLWFGETLHHLYLSLDRLDEVTTPAISLQKARNILGRADRPIVKTHTLPSLDRFEGKYRSFARSVLERAQVLYVVRDGRDVVCSAHLMRQSGDPRARCSLQEFMRQQRGREDLTPVEKWVRHVSAWSKMPDVKVIRFEDIRSSPETIIEELGAWLGLKPRWKQPYLPEKAKGRGRWADYWRRLTRNFESTAIQGRYKGKEPKDWRKTFTEADRVYFQQEAGDVLMNMGYIENERWVAEATYAGASRDVE